jgi:hypothetical protein
MVQPRRQRRAIAAPPSPSPTGITIIPPSVPTQPQPIVKPADVSSAPAALRSFLKTLHDAVRMRQYRLIGQLSRVQCMREDGVKTIDFRKEGPILGMLPGTEQIVVTTEWRGLPSRWNDTTEFCQDCLSDCDVCNATGTKACEGYRCGGSGKVPKPAVACPDCAAMGILNSKCETCKGTGMIHDMQKCSVCEGSGVMTCSVCRGTKKRPTGIEGGATNWRLPACSSCKGSKFAHVEIPQSVNDFVNARMGSMLALGPIVRFAVESVGGDGIPPQVYDVEADQNGQYMVILLEHDQPGAAAFMIGGVLHRA